MKYLGTYTYNREIKNKKKKQANTIGTSTQVPT